MKSTAYSQQPTVGGRQPLVCRPQPAVYGPSSALSGLSSPLRRPSDQGWHLASGIRRPAFAQGATVGRPSSPLRRPSDQGWHLASGIRRLCSGSRPAFAKATVGRPSSFFSGLASGIRRLSSSRRPSDQGWHLASGIRRLCSGSRPAFAKATVGRPSSPLRRPSDQGWRLASGIRRLSSSCRLPSAFTLVELLVVIVVIAILMSITLPLSKYAMRRANEARHEVMLAKMRSALDDYRAAYGEYPITPPASLADVLRHFPTNYPTLDAVQGNSSYKYVDFSTNSTVETIYDADSNKYLIDYCLTYPLMYKQLDKGARPFMVFPVMNVVFLATRGDTGTVDRWRRTKGGGKRILEHLLGLQGDAVQRAKAIDPMYGYQWLYTCTNGINYSLTNNAF